MRRAMLVALLWWRRSRRRVALAQDPVKVDAKHYKVEFENEQVRVLRITYGPGEKSVMHEHPDAVAAFLTDSKCKFHLPDGTNAGAGQEDGHGRCGPRPASTCPRTPATSRSS